MIMFIYRKFKQNKNKASKMIQKDDIKHKDYSHFLRLFHKLRSLESWRSWDFIRRRGFSQYLWCCSSLCPWWQPHQYSSSLPEAELQTMMKGIPGVYCTGFSETLHTTGGPCRWALLLFWAKRFLLWPKTGVSAWLLMILCMTEAEAGTPKCCPEFTTMSLRAAV